MRPAPRGPKLSEVVLTDEERTTLERWARRRSSRQALAQRCRIVLACAAGAPPSPSTWGGHWSTRSLARALGMNQTAVSLKRFLAGIASQVPAGLAVHVICDNSSTHKTPAIGRWLVAHPRFQLHFTPTTAWLNLVERWFAELTTKWLRGAATVGGRAEHSIQTWIDTWNDDPRPFVW